MKSAMYFVIYSGVVLSSV